MDRKELIDLVQGELSNSNNDNRLERLTDPNQQIIELEMRQRFIKAKELRRITPEKTPDFIGNFDNDYPRGIFEMFIKERDGNNIKGEVEDCFGTATFEGFFNNNTISFIKHYIPEKSSVDASESDIEYEGLLIGDKYCGEYVFTDNHKFGGEFSMAKDFSNQL